MTTDPDVAAGLEEMNVLCRAGHFFEAHEHLELRWKRSSGPQKILLQGLIQIAAGIYRLGISAGNVNGAYYMLDQGLAKLRAQSSYLTSDSLERIEIAIHSLKATGKIPEQINFDLRAQN